MCINCDTIYVFSRKQRIQLNKELNVDGIIDAAIKQLYDDRKIDKPTMQALFQSHYKPLQQAVNEGFTNNVEYGTPNYEFLKHLQTNTAIFSIFKAHAQVKEMAALLKDKDGNLRSKEDFKTEALKVDETYNTTHLDTEYDTAVRTARLAAQWQKFEKNKKLYPNLKYLLTKASKPDEKHLQYVGIIAPVDSIFWSTHYPPNRWRCQCGVEQTDEDATDIPHDLPPVDPEFAFNAGKTGQIFDVEKSSYIKSVPAKEQPALIKQATSFVNKEAAISAPYQTIYKSKSGTSVEAHPLAFDAPDYAESFKLARDLANSKLPVNTIQILPYLHTKKELKHKLLPDAKKDYDPDYRIDGVLVDGKQPSGKTASKNTIKNIISHAHDQANGVIIKIDKSNYIIDEQLYADIDNKFRNKAYDDFVLYLKYNDEWRMWNKEQWNEFYKAIKKP